MHFDWPGLTTVRRDGVGQVNKSSVSLARLPAAGKWRVGHTEGALGVGHWGGLTRDLHNLWPDTEQYILEKIKASEIIARFINYEPFNVNVWFMYMFKFQMEISIIGSIKLPYVSISKICTYRAFPIDLITHWSLVTLWKSFIQTYFHHRHIHNLYREESQTEGA